VKRQVGQHDTTPRAPRNDQRESRVSQRHGEEITASQNYNTVSDFHQFVAEKNT
jgi:hypothetical protein